MATLTATEASRGFSKMLDRVERDGEEFDIIRDGELVARVVPGPRGTVADVQRAFDEIHASGGRLFRDNALEELQELKDLLIPWEPTWADGSC